MSREAYRSLYGDLTKLKDKSLLSATIVNLNLPLASVPVLSQTLPLTGENTPAKGTTSITAVDLLSVTGLNIPASSPILVIFNWYRQTGASAQAKLGLKLNSTQVFDNTAVGAAANQTQSGTGILIINTRDTPYFLTPGWGVITNGQEPTITNLNAIDAPTTPITEVTITALVTNALIGIVVANLRVYSFPTGQNPTASATDDDQLWQLLLAVSEWIDSYLNRSVAPITTTKEFDGNGETILTVPDLISVTTLKEDTDGDGVYETTWAATDYELYPRNAEPTKHWGKPYTQLRVIKETEGSKKVFTAGQANFQIVGKFGYRELTEDSGTTTTAAGYTAAATTINTVAGEGTKLAVGQTILISAEQLLITAIATDALTVARGINGTTAATIAAALTTINILRWPSPIERAALIIAARLWGRAPAFTSDAQGIDPDAKALLDTYRRLAI